MAVTLPATSSGTILGLYTGTFATGLPYIGTGDVKNTSPTRYARIQFALPVEFVDYSNITIRAAAGMLTTVANTSATIDFECYLSNGDTTKSGSDLVSTSATSINSLTFGNKDFVLTALTPARGSVLDIRMTIATVDGQNVVAVIAAVAQVQLLLTIQG